MVMRLDLEPFDDPRVRQALRLVQDRQKRYKNSFSRMAGWATTTGYDSRCRQNTAPTPM